MRARLLYPDRDFESRRTLSSEEWDVERDLELGTLVAAMAGDDEFVPEVARSILLAGADRATVRYRQAVLADVLRHEATVRELYRLATEATDRRRQPYLGIIRRYPSGTLSSAVDALAAQLEMLRRLRAIADREAASFDSPGFTALFAEARVELADEALAAMTGHLGALRFRRGLLLSAELGGGNAGTGYVLRRPPARQPGWFARLLGGPASGLTFELHERDEAGARYLGEIRDRGLNAAANATAQAAEHVLAFFRALRSELAFYLGCLNLRARLEAVGAPTAVPHLAEEGSSALHADGLYDVTLALTLGRAPVGNTLSADGKSLVVITGANQGGKSSLLRAVGLAMIMLRCGMFVGASSFTAEPCRSLFTHYRREEDPTLRVGKLEEELARLSGIVTAIEPGDMLLLNESFSATTEREGSVLAAQATAALAANGVRLLFVTHLHQYARDLAAARRSDTLFLRAERLPDGRRTYRVVPGEPLETSYGPDLYRAIFGVRLRAAGLSDLGRRRGTDEEAYLVVPLGDSGPGRDGPGLVTSGDSPVLLAVADGMGGSQAAELASTRALATLRGLLPAHSEDWSTTLGEAVARTARVVSGEGQRPDWDGTGGMLTAVCVQGREAYLATVGNSRVYLLRGNELRRLTRDQSYRQLMVDAGAVDHGAAERPPLRRVTLQAVGQGHGLQVDTDRIDLEPADVLLVCSDGLWKEVPDDRIRGVLSGSSAPEHACRALVDCASERGGRDHITVVVARLDHVTRETGG